jgi:hypothetical protein
MVPMLACATCVLLLAWTLWVESARGVLQRPGERASQAG